MGGGQGLAEAGDGLPEGLLGAVEVAGGAVELLAEPGLEAAGRPPGGHPAGRGHPGADRGQDGDALQVAGGDGDHGHDQQPAGRDAEGEGERARERRRRPHGATHSRISGVQLSIAADLRV